MGVSSSTALELWGAVFCVIAAVTIDGGRKVEVRENICLGYMLAINAMVLICDCFLQMYTGLDHSIARIITAVAAFFLYLLEYLLVYGAVSYFEALLSSNTIKFPVWMKRLSISIVAASVLLLIGNLRWHYIYFFDMNNIYMRGPLFYLCQILPIGIVLIGLFIIIKYSKVLSSYQVFGCIIYVGMPIVAGIVMLVTDESASIINIAITLALLIMFVVYELEKSERMIKQANDLVEEERINNQFKNAMLWTQVQPHFIYNNLNVIQFLCVKDPQKAQEAIQHLSAFLRSYIDAYDLDVCVPVEEELEIVEHYIYMQKLRYENKLVVNMDIKTTKFMVPPLCIEVLVENAVKHGVIKKVEGGTVDIRTYENDDEFIAEVADDGVGFDVAEIENDGKNHVGLRNADGRIRYMCKGSLEVITAVGEGCTVKIHIPKGK